MMLGDDAQTVGHDAGYTLGWAPRCPLEWRRRGGGGRLVSFPNPLALESGETDLGELVGRGKV